MTIEDAFVSSVGHPRIRIHAEQAFSAVDGEFF